jgi:hypothetical protein
MWQGQDPPSLMEGAGTTGCFGSNTPHLSNYVSWEWCGVLYYWGRWTEKNLQGSGVLNIFQTQKRKCYVAERNKWLADLHPFIQDTHPFGCIWEATYDYLGCPIYHDIRGTNISPGHTTNTTQSLVIRLNNKRQFVLSIFENITVLKERTGSVSDQEISVQRNILSTNEETKATLHVFGGCDGDNWRPKFIDNPLILQHFHKLKGKFSQVRCVGPAV